MNTIDPAISDVDQAALSRAHDEREFAQLSLRYAQLGNSLAASSLRERATLEAPLMKLYLALHPRSGYRWDDDFDVVMRTKRT